MSQYPVDVAAMAQGDSEVVSEFRLAAALKHTKQHSQSELLTATVKGKQYTLMLMGYIEGVDTRTGEVFNSTTVTEEQLDELDVFGELSDYLEIEHGPWLEWVNAEGVSVTEAYGAVYADPKAEIADLPRLLQEYDW